MRRHGLFGTVLPEISGVVFGFARYAYLDLTVDVPKTASLKLDDSSGDMAVSNVEGATITDSSGDQMLENIEGDLDINDSSGEIRISVVGGGLRLRDSSGDIDVKACGATWSSPRQLGRSGHQPRHGRRAS